MMDDMHVQVSSESADQASTTWPPTSSTTFTDTGNAYSELWYLPLTPADRTGGGGGSLIRACIVL